MEKNRIRSPRTTNRKRRIKQSSNVWGGGASATSQSQGNSGVNNTGTQAVAMGLQARAIEAQVSNVEADTALKIAQATKEAGEASKKPIELKIEQTNKEITDLEKSLKTQNVEIGNEIVRTTAIAQKAMEDLNLKY